jgi:hypothetical protein
MAAEDKFRADFKPEVDRLLRRGCQRLLESEFLRQFS